MGFFSKQNPATEYEQHKTAYKSKMSVQKVKEEPLYIKILKCTQIDRTARICVTLEKGCLQVGDFLEIPYTFNNRLGIQHAVGQVTNIYQIQGTGKHEELIQTAEAYAQDMVWLDVSGIDLSLVDKQSHIRRSHAVNVTVNESTDRSISVSGDEEASKMVNYFKAELYHYFTSGEATWHISQDLAHSLLLQKKRLDRLGITMTIDRSSDIDAATLRMEVNRYNSAQHVVAEANEPIKLTRTYSQAGRIVYRDDDWRICHYLLSGTKNNNDGLIACPNCGNYAKREELLTGCPYCNTQFTIQDLSLRVSGYSQKKIEQTRMEQLKNRVNIDSALHYESNQKEYDQVLLHRMKEIDPLFSPTAFYNSMRNKLYSIVFAEDSASLQNLADEDFDVTPFYDLFRDVIDIDIQSIETKNIKKNTQYVLVDAIMTTMVLRYNALTQTAQWTKESITMSFVKNIKNKTKNIFEPSVIRCEACGGSYSLYEGKACSYCGHEIDYLMYDWLLIDMARSSD